MLQSFVPSISLLAVSPVLAQDALPSSVQATPTVEQTTPTPTPTVEQTLPSSVQAVTPTTEATPTAELSPTDAPLPVATDTPVPTTAQPETSPTPTPTPSVSPIPPPSPTPTVVASSEEGVITAVLYTDKADYAPTEVALIFGNNFTPNETYTLEITADNLAVSVEVTADENGNFAYSYQLDGTYRPLYNVVAKDSSGAVVATTSFTDAPPALLPSVSNFSQCTNDDGDGYTTGDIGCHWTNGDINNSNSLYHEGDGTPQRLHLTDSTNGLHTVKIEYQTTKGGKHAYDFETDDNFSELSPNTITDADFCNGLSSFADCSTLTPSLSPLIPTDSNAGGFDVAPNRHFKIRNGTITVVGTPTLVSGTYGADSLTDILVTYNVDTSTCVDKDLGNDTCPVLITWSGHIAREADWGTGNAAVDIHGSPYHQKVVGTDSKDVSSRDNQMAANAVVQTGTITLDKVTVPSGDLTLFTFSTTNLPAPTAPSLADATTPVSWSSLANGTYTITETVPTDWTLTGRNCTGASASVVTNITNGVSIALSGGETIACTFTNTRNQGTIELKKVWSGTGGQTTLNIGTTAGASDVDTQLTGAAGAAPLTTGQNTVNTGTYFNSETGGLTDYTTGALVCYNDANNNGTNDDSSPVAVGANDSVAVTTGQHVICTYTNTRNQGKIELQKDFVGSPENVTIKIGTSQNGSQIDSDVLSADGTDGEHTVDTGTFFVSEVLTTPANYNSSLACYNDVNDNDAVDGGDAVHTVNASTGELAVGNNEDVLCVYTNTRKTGTIELKKVWSGTGGQTTLNIGTSNSGSQTDTQLTGAAGAVPLTTGQNTVDTGTYFNSETGGLTDYTTGALVCYNDANNNGTNDDSSPVTVGANDSVAVTTGQHVICTYTNTRNTGKIQLTKDFVGTAENVTIKIGTSGGGSQVESKALSADGTTDEHTVDTGSYFVSEALTTPANYDTTLECFNDVNDDDTVDGGDTSHSVNTGTGAVTVGNNDDVICRFTNTRKTGTIELKKHWVGDAGTTSLTIGSTVDGDEVATQAVVGIDDTTGQNTVDTGTYYGNETGGLTNYDQSALSCFNDVNNNGANDSEPSVTVGASNAVPVGSGEHVICTFINTQHGQIIVDKVTDPSGDTQSFNFTAGGTGYTSFSLTDADTPNDQEVSAGAYSVSEGAVAGWDSDGGVCDQGETPASVDVGPGETVTCTFTNTKRVSLTIVKDARPNDCQDFDFAMTGQSGFSLDDDSGVADCTGTNQPQSKTTNNLVPGPYTVTETLPNAFWEFGGVTCVNVDQSTHAITPVTNGGTVTLEPGADVTCTFINNKLGPTRTLGFWKTHTEYTSGIFNNQLGGSIQLGSGTSQEVIDSTNKLFGAWYSSISQKSTGKGKAAQRLPVDQARMQLAWQWLAATLNCASFGCPATIQTLLTDASAAYAAGNISAMLSYASQLDAYNNSGDTITIGPAGSATPKTSQGLANLSFWDNP